MIEKTFGMIKPEGLSIAADIEERIRAAELEIEERKELTLTPNQFGKIYGHAKTKIPDVYEDLKVYMTTNPVVVLCVKGEDARKRLLDLRGASNAAEAAAGTVRGDYAQDQDYRTLYAKRKFAKNVFHAADAGDAEEMVGIFCGGEG